MREGLQGWWSHQPALKSKHAASDPKGAAVNTSQPQAPDSYEVMKPLHRMKLDSPVRVWSKAQSELLAVAEMEIPPGRLHLVDQPWM